MRRSRLLARLLRYGAVSVISTSVTLSLLALLAGTGALSPGWANLAATGVGTIPSFELNRRWVWGRRSRRSVVGEVLPFAGLSFAGLACSTLAVAVASGWATNAHLGRATVTVVAEGANLATFGLLWVLQFLLCDRFLFAARDGVAAADRSGEIKAPWAREAALGARAERERPAA